MEDYPIYGAGSTGNGTSGDETNAGVLQSARDWLGALEVGEGAHHRNLTVFPLFPKGAKGAMETADSSKESDRYLLIDDAIEAGQAVVEEVSEGGSVPLLAVSSTAIKPILIPEGQILVGAKQNRTVNLTVLVPAGKSFELPVACVESGRWNYASRHFKAESYANPKLREKKIKSAQRRRAAGGQAFSDQSEVWASVDEHLHALEAPSPTSNLVDGYKGAEGRVKDYREKIRLPKGACGFLAASGGRVVGLDVFDAPATLQKLWGRLGEAYYVQAVSDDREEPRAEKGLAEGFLASIAGQLTPAAAQPQLGFELELAGEEFSGAALWHEGAVCHLAAFSVEA